MKRQFPFRPHSQIHSSVLHPLSPAYPPLRVQLARSLGTWCAVYSLYVFFPKARGLRHQSSSWCARLSRARTPMPHPTLHEGLDVSLGSPVPTSHSPSHPSRSLPCSVEKTQTACVRWRVAGGPLRALRLPSHHAGEGRWACMAMTMTALRWPLRWCRSNHFERDWLASQTRYARGSFSRRALHASGDAPWHSSAQHPLLEACLLRMVSFRAMLLTSQSGLRR